MVKTATIAILRRARGARFVHCTKRRRSTVATNSQGTWWAGRPTRHGMARLNTYAASPGRSRVYSLPAPLRDEATSVCACGRPRSTPRQRDNTADTTTQPKPLHNQTGVHVGWLWQPNPPQSRAEPAGQLRVELRRAALSASLWYAGRHTVGAATLGLNLRSGAAATCATNTAANASPDIFFVIVGCFFCWYINQHLFGV